ncbi:MAG: DNA gyrase inhibitor YacG [Pseudomonadota bacterium]
MTCPLCGKPTDVKARPFCSKRCADLDLARWLNGSYAVPSNDPDDAEALEQALDAERISTETEKRH